MLYQQISWIYFPKHQTIHSYSTWPSTSEDFYIKNTRLSQLANSRKRLFELQLKFKKTLSRVGAKIWNEIPPNSLKKLAKKAFKKELKAMLVGILKNEDAYITTPTIRHTRNKWILVSLLYPINFIHIFILCILGSLSLHASFSFLCPISTTKLLYVIHNNITTNVQTTTTTTKLMKI